MYSLFWPLVRIKFSISFLCGEISYQFLVMPHGKSKNTKKKLKNQYWTIWNCKYGVLGGKEREIHQIYPTIKQTFAKKIFFRL
mmetsp:Transcript_27272/g.55691  ORF Transcript_27272/g.55691 Transcript_27272/m.55691 type:complete len:83 (+) Transcript_27272:96-344(+)